MLNFWDMLTKSPRAKICIIVSHCLTEKFFRIQESRNNYMLIRSKDLYFFLFQEVFDKAAQVSYKQFRNVFVDRL